MFGLDEQIDQLVLKWANDVHGTWGEVIDDLLKFKEELLSEKPQPTTSEYTEEAQQAA